MLIQITANIATTAQDLILIQEFSFTERDMGKNVIISEADMSLSMHIDDKNKDILIEDTK